MNRELLSNYISAGLSTRKIADAESVSQSTIKHWLKKHGLKTKPIRSSARSDHICGICSKPLVQRMANRNASKCDGCIQKQRRYLLRISIVEYLGGKCNRCGWQGHLSGYDVHHTDPSQKDFALSSPNNKSLQKIKEEADKCELLCALCHRKEHTSYSDEFIATIKNKNRYDYFFK